MDEDRITGAAQNIGGKVKDAVGGVMGDSKTQAEGKMDQVAGTLQNAYGAAKDTVRETAGTVRETAGEAGSQIEDFVKAQPLLALLGAMGLGFALARLFDRE